MSDGPAKIDRPRDLYRVHDAAKKQKKDRKGGDEHEFLDLLEESGRSLEEFEQEKPKKSPQQKQPPAKLLLNRLSTSTPPPIQMIGESADGEKKEE